MAFLLLCHDPYNFSMGKVEDFSKVIKVVTELTDVSDQEILGKSRKENVVDARWMVIYFMRMMGYESKEIAKLINHPERTINNATQMFLDRVKYSRNDLGNIFYSARQQLL